MHRSLIIFFLSLCGVLIALTSSSQSFSPLLLAIKNNDTVRVASLIGSGADISVADEDGDCALMYAALYSTAGCMKQLLQNGANPNLKNKLDETAIMWCSHDLEKTKLLLQHKADVNNKTTDGNTPLLVASVGTAQTEILRLLIQHGADPSQVNNNKNTPLMRVAIYGDTVSARLLLNKGVDINAKNSDDENALFPAIRSGNKEMALWLLANGIEANTKDIYKATPLSYAVVVNDMDLVNALISKTTGIDEQDIDGMTILMWAVYSEYDNLAIVQLLLDKGASMNLKDKKGQSALAWALKKGNTPTVTLLKKAGAQE